MQLHDCDTDDHDRPWCGTWYFDEDNDGDIDDEGQDESWCWSRCPSGYIDNCDCNNAKRTRTTAPEPGGV